MTFSKPLQYITVLPATQKFQTRYVQTDMGLRKIHVRMKKAPLKFAIRSETPIIKGKKK